MSSKRQKRKERAQKRARERTERNSVGEGLKLLGYETRGDYEEEWRKLKQEEAKQMITTKEITVPHDELIPVPWAWETAIADSTTKKQVSIKSRSKDGKGEALSLYVQGEQLFMIRKGITQKMTPFHSFVLIGDDGKRYDATHADVIDWTLKNVKGLLPTK